MHRTTPSSSAAAAAALRTVHCRPLRASCSPLARPPPQTPPRAAVLTRAASGASDTASEVRGLSMSLTLTCVRLSGVPRRERYMHMRARHAQLFTCRRLHEAVAWETFFFGCIVRSLRQRTRTGAPRYRRPKTPWCRGRGRRGCCRRWAWTLARRRTGWMRVRAFRTIPALSPPGFTPALALRRRPPASHGWTVLRTGLSTATSLCEQLPHPIDTTGRSEGRESCTLSRSS